MQLNVAPFTPVVKRLVIANVAIWVVLVLLAQNFFMDRPLIFEWFGMIPLRVISDFWIWQPITYMFIHSNNAFHVVFNMLILWMFGAELEQRWGSRFFFTYYMVSGVGAGVLYLLGLAAYYLATGNIVPLTYPVVGASGAVFGMILAYGLIFGERVIYFMMIFPMKAKFFVMIIGAIEVITLLDTGVSGRVANLAHIGGLVSGFLFLLIKSRWKGGKRRKPPGKRGRKLRLVVDNERKWDDDDGGPRYWH